MKIFGIDFSQKPEPEPSKSECLHHNMQDAAEGIRFCVKCKIVERFEKNKFPEPGQKPWKWRELPKDEAVRIINDLKKRINS